ncbi:MAG: hypothetical protein ACYC6A_14130 [Armatimonadota bacterium]
MGRFLLFLILLAGAGAFVWYAARPAPREFRDAQHTDDLAYVGIIAENAELLLADPPLDTTRALGEVVTSLFDSEENLAAVRILDAQGAVLCQVGRDDPDNLLSKTAFTDFSAATPGKPAADLMFQLQLLVANQSELSGRMEDALKSGKGGGLHHGLYALQDENIKVSELLRAKAPRLGEALPAMQEVVEALTHTDESSLYLAQQASQQAEASLSLALEEARAVTDFPGRLPKALAAAIPADLLPLQARRVTVPLYTPTGDAALVAPAGTVEVIFADRPTDMPLVAAHRVLATPLRWAPPAVLLLAAVLLAVRKRRKVEKPAEAGS